ncbi:hypothetical protein MRX96_019056 [Rhipicephalus microplus]
MATSEARPVHGLQAARPQATGSTPTPPNGHCGQLVRRLALLIGTSAERRSLARRMATSRAPDTSPQVLTALRRESAANTETGDSLGLGGHKTQLLGICLAGMTAARNARGSRSLGARHAYQQLVCLAKVPAQGKSAALFSRSLLSPVDVGWASS